MNFFQTIKNSVYNPQFYNNIKEQKPSSAVKYFAKLTFLIACIVAIVSIFGGIGVLTWKQDVIDDTRTNIINTFPEELTVQIKNGEISTNVEEPYAIVFPEFVKQAMSREKAASLPANLLVINTHKSIEIADFQEYQTLAILGKNETGFIDPDKGKIEIQSLGKTTSNYTLDRPIFESFVNKAWQVIKVVGIVLIILSPFIIFAGIFICYLIYLLFGALIVWFASNVTKQSLTYGQSYKAGLYLITLPLIISFFLPFLFHLPFVFSIALFIMAYINFKQPEVIQRESVVQKEASEVPSSDIIKDAEVVDKKN